MFDMQEALQLITAKLSSKVPVVINHSSGIIGRDAISDEFKEIPLPELESLNGGIMLTVGFVPWMKVKLISCPYQVKDYPQAFMIDKFITDIWEFSTSISGRQSPAAIMIFSIPHEGMNYKAKLDYAMSPETVIVGSFCNNFRHTATKELSCNAVALVLVTDRNKPPGVGETRFHAILSSGLSPVGPTFRVDSVSENPSGCMTRLVVHREGPFEAIGMGEFPARYIGVTKRSKCSIGQEKSKWMTSLAFHEIFYKGEDNVSFSVEDVGIETGDTFRCYHPDSNAARSTVDSVSNLLRSFKQRSTNGSVKWEVCGGLIFTSMHRDKTFLGHPNGDSSPFLENFPGVTFAGTMCLGEIGRGYLIPRESPEQKLALKSCFLQICSAVI